MTSPAPLSPLHPAYWLSTWFYVGKVPFAPGTFGSLAALPLAWFVQVRWGGEMLILLSLLIFFIGWWSSAVYMRRVDCEHDPSEIVIDEVAGQCLLLSVVNPDWQGYLICFGLFRLFDIIKPWPINIVDRRVHGGLGVMLDDMLAGLFPMLLILWVL